MWSRWVVILVLVASCTSKRQAGYATLTGFGVTLVAVGGVVAVDPSDTRQTGGARTPFVVMGTVGLGVGLVSLLNLLVLLAADPGPSPSPAVTN